MRIKVSIWHDDGSYQEYDGTAALEQVVDDEAEYVVTRENGCEHIVQAPATEQQIADSLCEDDD